MKHADSYDIAITHLEDQNELLELILWASEQFRLFSILHLTVLLIRVSSYYNWGITKSPDISPCNIWAVGITIDKLFLLFLPRLLNKTSTICYRHLMVLWKYPFFIIFIPFFSNNWHLLQHQTIENVGIINAYILFQLLSNMNLWY